MVKIVKVVPRLALFLVPLTSSAQARRPRLSDDEVVRRVNAYIAPLAEHELSGTLLVARGNRILLERAYGLANYELGVRFTPSNPTNIASITKPLTVIIAARLADDKKLSWGDTVSKWLPNYVYGSKMTIKQLIDHRSGVPHRLMSDAEETEPHTAQEMVEIANRVPLLFQPGTSESYSSGGYAILAAVLERGQWNLRRAAPALCGEAGVREDDQTCRQSGDSSRTCKQCDSDCDWDWYGPDPSATQGSVIPRRCGLGVHDAARHFPGDTRAR